MYVACVTFPTDVLFNVYVEKCQRKKLMILNNEG